MFESICSFSGFNKRLATANGRASSLRSTEGNEVKMMSKKLGYVS